MKRAMHAMTPHPDHAMLAALVDATQDFVWVVDCESFGLLWWNRAVGEFLGERGVALQVGQTTEGAQLGGMDTKRLDALYRRAVEEDAISVETRLGPSVWLSLDFTKLTQGAGTCGIMVTGRNITERKQIELEREDALERLAEEQRLLKQREEEQQLLLRSAPAAIFEVDLLDLRFVKVNDYVLETLGYSQEELLALSPLELLDETSAARVRCALADLTAGSELANGREYTVSTRDGGTLSVVLTASPIFEDGRAVRGLVVGHDITPQRLAHERMLRAEEKYRTVVENIHEGLVILSADDELLYANEMACRSIDHTLEELLAVPFAEHLHPDDRAMAHEAGRRIFATGEPLAALEFRLITRTGKTLWVSVHTSLVDWDGRPALAVLLDDITERERAAEQLESSEHRYRTVVDNLQEGVIVATRDEKIYSNHRLAEILGFTPEEFAQVPFLAQVHPEDMPAVQRQLSGAFDEGETTTRFYFRAMDKEGQVKWLHCRAAATDWLGRHAVIGFMDDVTAEIQAEAAVKQSTDIMNTMFRSIQDGFYMTAVEDGRLLELNHGFEEMFGLCREEAIGRTTTELGLWNDPDDRSRFAGMLQSRGYLHDFTIVGRRKDGETFPASMSAATVEIDGKKCIVGTVRDETERARAQRALVESEARYRLLADNIGDVIWMADSESLRFTYVSPSCRQLDGYDPEELVGVSLVDRVVPAARPARVERFGVMLKEFLAADSPYVDFDTEVEIERKDGSTVWADVRTRFFRDPSTGRPGIIGLTRDKSRQKAAEDALRDKQEQLDRFFSLEVGLLSITDLQGRFRLVSAGWESTLGQPAADLLERSLFDFVHPEDQAVGREAMCRLSSQADPVDFVARVWAIDGTLRTIAWRAAPAGDLVYAAARDITDLVAAEERLRQSQKMEAIGQLAGGIAHDFNNLLTAILGYSDLLLASPQGQQEGVMDDLLEIKGAAKRAAALTQQILAFSRKQALHPEVICINHVLTDLRPLLERLLGETVALEVWTAEDLGLCEIDPIQFTQVLINLIVNAKDAMPQGGVLILETANVSVDGLTQSLALADLEPGDYVALKCTDTGTGMDQKTTTRIFEPFFTTKGSGQGTGLGLSTVHGIVHQSGGTVLVQSEVGQGTVFTIYLPLITGVELHPSERDESAGCSQGSASILVVEDEEAVGALVRRVLEARGYRVMSAKDAVEALAILSDKREPLDLLLTDMVVPGGMHGGELADTATSMRPDLEVIYMSGYSRDFNIHGGSLDASVRFLQKPFTSNSLTAKVEEALAGRKGKGQDQR